MDSYSNDDKNIRINRFITAEFLPAVKKYKMARKLLENWTIETDATIYQFCAECSDKLYEAVEHFLREAIATDTNNIISLIGLCDKVKDDSRFYDIELSVFVTKKEPRNASTHHGRLQELGDYQRVIDNLIKLIRIVDPTKEIGNIEGIHDKFDYNKFWYDTEEFAAENTHYILFIDPINDIAMDSVEAVLSLPWSIIVDFDGREVNGKVYKEVLANSNAQMCNIVDVKKQGISEVTFRLKAPVYISMEKGVAPRRFADWKRKDKNNFEYFIGKSKTLEKDKAIVVIAKGKDKTTDLFLEKIIDEYGVDNVRIIFLEGSFSNDEIDDMSDEYNDFCYYQNLSVLDSLSEIAKYQCINKNVKQSAYEGIKLPSYEGVVNVYNKSLVDNLNQYFEVLDVEKGKSTENIYSEEDFLKGELISWEALNLKYDILPIPEGRYQEFIGEIEYSLKAVSSKYKLFSLLHKPGFGGTTLSRRIAWDLHTQFPVVILKRYSSSETWNLLTALYENVKKGILIVADENNVSQSEIEKIQKEAQNSIFPVVLLSVSRIRYKLKEKEKEKRILYLNVMEPEIYEKIEQRCETLAKKKFNERLITKRKNAIQAVNLQERCPLLIGLYFLEELFEGTEQYVSRFIQELDNTVDEVAVKEVMSMISMCDYFGQKKVYPVLLEKILNPTRLRGYSVKNTLRKVQELFKFNIVNGCTYVEAKHYLISKEIIRQLFVQQGKSNNWKDYIVTWSKKFIDLSISVCETKIDFDLQELLKDMFIENRETEYLKGKFSILLESCSLETDKEEVLRYLAEKFEDFVEDSINIESEECNEHQLLAHFWGHLGRLFSQKGALNNFTKAEDCCKKALNYSEKTGSYDYIILHIAGDSISKRKQMILDNIYEYSDLQKNIEVIKEGISEAQEYFNKSAAYGNQQYGYVGLLTLWSKFFIKFFSVTGIKNMFDLQKLENVCEKLDSYELSEWVMSGITVFTDLLETLDIENYSEIAVSMIYGIKSDIAVYMKHNEHFNVLGELNNYLDKLTIMSVKDSSKISNVKRMIIRNVLTKYYDEEKHTYSKFLKTDKKTKSDLALIMQYLDENIVQETRTRNDFALWFKLMRYSDRSIDDAIKKGHQWYAYQEDIGEKDYLPPYYLYVLYYLRALDGYSNAICEAEKFRSRCRKVCEERRGDFSKLNYDRVRDWIGSDKGLKRLLDDHEADYTRLMLDDRYMTVQGKFKEIDPSSRRIFGYMEITDPVFLKGTKVFFKPNECGVSARQIEHLFEFKVGFSLERLVAFDKSVVDISGNAAKNVSEYKDKQLIGKKTIAIGDIVHISFFTYQKEKNRLKGIISENGKYAFLYKSEVSYEKYITDSDMEIYVGVDSNAPIEVKTIAYNDKYDYYMVSLKQLVLGESSMVEHGDLYNALKNIKIE